MSWRRKKKLPLGMREIALIGILLSHNTLSCLYIRSYTYCYSHNLPIMCPLLQSQCSSNIPCKPGCYVSPIIIPRRLLRSPLHLPQLSQGSAKEVFHRRMLTTSVGLLVVSINLGPLKRETVALKNSTFLCFPGGLKYKFLATFW